MFTLPSGRLDGKNLTPPQQEALTRCEEIAEFEECSPEPAPKKSDIFSQVVNGLLKLFKRCDIFGVKPNFNASPGNTSALGCFLTLVILGLSFMTLGVTLFHWEEKIPVVTQRNVSPSDAAFTVTTGEGFRPAFCTGWSGRSSIEDGEVGMHFYKYIDGVKSIINAIQMESGQKDLLGIEDNDAETYISTSYCFRMPDG